MPGVNIDPNDVMIQLRGLRKSFGTQQVLKSVTLDIRRGETMVIIGKSGGGKSVILKHMIGLLQPDDGEVEVDGDIISTSTEFKTDIIRQKMGMLFQSGAVFDSMTAAENIAFALREHNKKMSEEAIQDYVDQCLRMIHLDPKTFRNKMPSHLSGGQRKRTALARAIALKPQILLYDEPTTGLDPITSDAINDLILDMQKQLGMTSVVVTHDMISAFKIGDRIAMLHNGEIICLGTPDEIKALADLSLPGHDTRVAKFVHGMQKLPADYIIGNTNAKYSGNDDEDSNAMPSKPTHDLTDPEGD